MQDANYEILLIRPMKNLTVAREGGERGGVLVELFQRRSLLHGRADKSCENGREICMGGGGGHTCPTKLPRYEQFRVTSTAANLQM